MIWACLLGYQWLWVFVKVQMKRGIVFLGQEFFRGLWNKVLAIRLVWFFFGGVDGGGNTKLNGKKAILKGVDTITSLNSVNFFHCKTEHTYSCISFCIIYFKAIFLLRYWIPFVLGEEKNQFRLEVISLFILVFEVDPKLNPCPGDSQLQTEYVIV